MRRALTVVSLIYTFTMLLVACSTDEPTGNKPTTPEPIPEPKPLTESHTLIVCMQGDNGLAEFMDLNLQRILASYYDIPTGIGRIVVFYDRGNYTRLTELYIDDGMVKQRLIKEYNTQTATTDKAFFEEMLALAAAEAPADSYGLILSSHGGGWVPAELYDSYLLGEGTRGSEPVARPQFYGQDGADCMEIPELAEAIDTLDFNYILFDACFMGNIEALYDLRHTADYIIASPAEVLGTGFPYEKIMPMLFEYDDHSLEAVCEEFMAMYRESSGTITLVDCSKLDALADAVASVYAACGEQPTVDATAVQAYEHFDYHLYFDLGHYIESIADATSLARFDKALDEALLYVGNSPTILSSTGAGAISLNRHSGLTTYVYQPSCPETYAAWRATAWAQRVLGL